MSSKMERLSVWGGVLCTITSGVITFDLIEQVPFEQRSEALSKSIGARLGEVYSSQREWPVQRP